jgi:hypothetical protein
MSLGKLLVLIIVDPRLVLSVVRGCISDLRGGWYLYGESASCGVFKEISPDNRETHCYMEIFRADTIQYQGHRRS